METDELADSTSSDLPSKKDKADETVLNRIKELYGSMESTTMSSESFSLSKLEDMELE
ncbi:MAG: hypothetical protein FWH40_08165 [Coriobacteriia bacterium]|nr:hypothetical protein [Coriobacteriia bacterium]